MIPITAADALIAVDIQNDFLENGALGVHEGHHTVPVVNMILPLFSTVVFTKDWHPANHCSFSAEAQYRDGSWPTHCVEGTPGARFHPDLHVPEGALVVSKGTLPDREEYSGFQATGSDLAGRLRERGVRRIFLAGIATDYCVHFTALDGVREGFEVWVIEDAVRGVAPDTTAQTWRELAEAGVGRVHSSDLCRQMESDRDS